MASDPALELVDVVNDEGRTLRIVTRREMRTQRLPHRCTYVLVFNQAGDLFVHLRTAGKDVNPSQWDACIGGVVSAGESFTDGVRREVAEELGVEVDPTAIEELFPFRYADDKSIVQAVVYRLRHDGPFRLQPEEIVRGEFVPLNRIDELARERPVCADSLAVLARLRQHMPETFATWPTNQRILLGSGGFRTDERLRFLRDEMRGFFGDIDRLLFIPYALADYDRYLQSMMEKVIDAGYRLDGIHRHADPHKAIEQAPALFIGGGNTFRLLSTLYRFGLLEVIRRRVREGMPYLGISAGTNVACPTIKTTNDMPIVQPADFNALGVVSFQINPHYIDVDPNSRHMGETREKRIAEFHEENDSTVVGLREGSWIVVDQGRATLHGDTGARVFVKGNTPIEWDVETDRPA